MSYALVSPISAAPEAEHPGTFLDELRQSEMVTEGLPVLAELKCQVTG